jgi:sterol desaturase/sphingolipid hydroxylase (fatty acid hydroxylase superfamily)
MNTLSETQVMLNVALSIVCMSGLLSLLVVGYEQIVYIIQKRWSTHKYVLSASTDESFVLETEHTETFTNLFIAWLPVFVIHYSVFLPTTVWIWSFDRYTLLYFVGYLYFQDLWFYGVHRTFHKNRFLYRHLHRRHHERIQPTVFDSIRGRAIEYICLFSMPLIAFNYLISVPGKEWNIMSFSLVVWATQYINIMGHTLLSPHPLLLVICPLVLLHYFMPFHSSQLYHVNHHANQSSNYASYFKLWDMCFGTYESPRKRFHKVECVE